MRKRTRRNRTPAFRAKVALAVVKGDKTLGCRISARMPGCLFQTQLRLIGQAKNYHTNYLILDGPENS